MNLTQSVRRFVPRTVRVVMRLELAVVFAGSVLLGCHDTPTSPTAQRFKLGPGIGATINAGSFTIRDLGTVGGLWSDAYDINDSGDIVGVSADSNGWGHATLWAADGSAPRDLGGLNDYGGGSAMGINTAGDIVGSSPNSSGQGVAVLWPAGGGAPRDLGTLPGTSSSSARDINDAGDVVGSVYVGEINPVERAILWPASGGPPRDLGPGRAYAINSAGTIVGNSPLGATLWPAGGGTPRALGGTWAFGINDAGDVVGGDWRDAPASAVLWPADGSAPRYLASLGGTYAYARAINKAGDIVGYSALPNGETRGVLWRADGSAPQDLGILAATDWSSAAAIDSTGRIVGVSHSPEPGAQPRGVVWQPIRQHPQEITFESTPPTGAIAGGTYTVSATGGGSGNAVTFTSLAPTVCSVAGNAVSLDAGGTCTIAADQAGSAGYLAAPQVTQSFDINGRPVASAGSAQSGTEGSVITFDASASSDPDGDALTTYTWDFGDGTAESVTTPTVQHIYNDNKVGGGPYVATLTVTDARGATSASVSTSVLIGNIAPTATFAPASPVGEGTIGLSLSGVQDAPADVTTLQYAFDCGDGIGYRPFGSSASFACPATDNGMRSVRARVKDKDGAESEYTGSVAVVNVAPTITIIAAPPNGKTGVDYPLAFKFTDPGTGDAPWTYQITWGDGKNAPGATSTNVQGDTITGKHRYTKSGSYTITLRATDKDGGAATSTVQVAIVR